MTNETRLRYLYESARLGTMHAASEKLEVATSSISRQIAKLEGEIGLPLIEKGVRKIRLTEAGEIVYKLYQERMSQEEVFRSRIQEIKKIRTGKIVLAVGEAFVTQRFSDMLDAFMQFYPGLEVTVDVSRTTQVVRQVGEDNAHLGLIFDVPTEPRISARLVIPQPVKLIVNKSHPFAERREVDLKEIQGEPIGLPDGGYRIRQVIHMAERENGVFLQTSLITNSLTLLTDFVISGRGITLLPEIVVHEQLEQQQLRAVTVSSPILNGTRTSLITRSGRQLPIGAYKLMQSVEAYMRESEKAAI